MRLISAEIEDCQEQLADVQRNLDHIEEVLRSTRDIEERVRFSVLRKGFIDKRDAIRGHITELTDMG